MTARWVPVEDRNRDDNQNNNKIYTLLFVISDHNQESKSKSSIEFFLLSSFPIYSFIARSFFGSAFGNIVTFPLCGVLVDSYGWPTAFYVIGSITLVWLVFWDGFISQVYLIGIGIWAGFHQIDQIYS